MSFLSVEGLVVRYGGATILHGLYLGVERGTLVALLGSSGSGKTTLLRAVAGFNPVASGRVVLDGQDITRLPPEKRRSAMVFQSYALWPHMTVAQNIGYGLKLRGVARTDIAAKVERMLALLHLPGLGARPVTQLSGGQRQRVALGRALAIDPDVLLLDEPLSNLDARIRVELRHEIRAVQQRVGITALHVTHDREEAMVIADRIVVLRDGAIAQQGTPQDVYHRPASPFVAQFMGADNVVRLGAGQVPVGVVPAGSAAEYHAHFRAAAARLLPGGEPLPAATLGIPGRIVQASYPGDVWRYTVEAEGVRYVIDDPAPLVPGDAVRIAIPAAALYLFPAQEAAMA